MCDNTFLSYARLAAALVALSFGAHLGYQAIGAQREDNAVRVATYKYDACLKVRSASLCELDLDEELSLIRVRR